MFLVKLKTMHLYVKIIKSVLIKPIGFGTPIIPVLISHELRKLQDRTEFVKDRPKLLVSYNINKNKK